MYVMLELIYLQGIASLHNMRSPMVHGDFKPSDVLVTARAKVPKITNFGLWDFKKFFIENTMAEDVVFLNPHQAPEVSIIINYLHFNVRF